MRSLAARPDWEEQMFPNWHLCCPGVSSSDNVPLPPLALSLPLDLQPQRMSQRCLLLCRCPTWSCPSPARGAPVEGSLCPCWPSPRVTKEAIGAALAARPEGNAAFPFFHLFGERRRMRREPRPAAPGRLRLSSSSLPPRLSRCFPAHPLGSA